MKNITRRGFINTIWLGALTFFSFPKAVFSKKRNRTDNFSSDTEKISMAVTIENLRNVNRDSDKIQVIMYGQAYYGLNHDVEIVSDFKIEEKQLADEFIVAAVPDSVWQFEGDYLVLMEYEVMVIFPDSCKLIGKI